jgi:hypothetical protein
MKTRQWMKVAALVSAIGFAGGAAAADASHTVGQLQNNQNVDATPQGATVGGHAAVGGSQRMDNANPSAAPLDTWMNDYATAHNGRITRDEFMSEMGNRWDALDAQRQGLTAEQAQGLFTAHPGEPVGAMPAQSGSQVNPGYMGPGSVKGK